MNILKSKSSRKTNKKHVSFYKKVVAKKEKRGKLNSCCKCLSKSSKIIAPTAIDNKHNIESDIKSQVMTSFSASTEKAVVVKLNKKIKKLQTMPKQVEKLQGTVNKMQTQMQQLLQHIVKLKHRMDTYEYSYRYDLEVGDR